MSKMVTLDDMIHTGGYIVYESETVANLQHRIINSRFYGDIESVTHGEIIECFEEYIDLYLDEIRHSLIHEIRILEEHHKLNGSLDEEVYDLRGDN